MEQKECYCLNSLERPAEGSAESGCDRYMWPLVECLNIHTPAWLDVGEMFKFDFDHFVINKWFPNENLFSVQIYSIRPKMWILICLCLNRKHFVNGCTQGWYTSGGCARAAEIPIKVIKVFLWLCFSAFVGFEDAVMSLCPYRIFKIQHVLWLLFLSFFLH